MTKFDTLKQPIPWIKLISGTGVEFPSLIGAMGNSNIPRRMQKEGFFGVKEITVGMKDEEIKVDVIFDDTFGNIVMTDNPPYPEFQEIFNLQSGNWKLEFGWVLNGVKSITKLNLYLSMVNAQFRHETGGFVINSSFIGDKYGLMNKRLWTTLEKTNKLIRASREGQVEENPTPEQFLKAVFEDSGEEYGVSFTLFGKEDDKAIEISQRPLPKEATAVFESLPIDPKGDSTITTLEGVARVMETAGFGMKVFAVDELPGGATGPSGMNFFLFEQPEAETTQEAMEQFHAESQGTSTTQIEVSEDHVYTHRHRDNVIQSMNLNTDQFKDTRESIAARAAFAESAAASAAQRQGQRYGGGDTNYVGGAENLFKMWAGLFYGMDMTLLGDPSLIPLTNIELSNIGIFSGVYHLLGVTHKLSPGSFVTDVSGNRAK